MPTMFLVTPSKVIAAMWKFRILFICCFPCRCCFCFCWHHGRTERNVWFLRSFTSEFKNCHKSPKIIGINACLDLFFVILLEIWDFGAKYLKNPEKFRILQKRAFLHARPWLLFWKYFHYIIHFCSFSFKFSFPQSVSLSLLVWFGSVQLHHVFNFCYVFIDFFLLRLSLCFFYIVIAWQKTLNYRNDARDDGEKGAWVKTNERQKKKKNPNNVAVNVWWWLYHCCRCYFVLLLFLCVALLLFKSNKK